MNAVPIVVLGLFVVWYVSTRKTEKMTDRKTVESVIQSVRSVRPELVPIETLYIDPDGTSRFMFFNTNTYAGEIYDYNSTHGIIRDIQGINEKPKLYDYVKA